MHLPDNVVDCIQHHVYASVQWDRDNPRRYSLPLVSKQWYKCLKSSPGVWENVVVRSKDLFDGGGIVRLSRALERFADWFQRHGNEIKRLEIDLELNEATGAMAHGLHFNVGYVLRFVNSNVEDLKISIKGLGSVVNGACWQIPHLEFPRLEKLRLYGEAASVINRNYVGYTQRSDTLRAMYLLESLARYRRLKQCYLYFNRIKVYGLPANFVENMALETFELNIEGECAPLPLSVWTSSPLPPNLQRLSISLPAAAVERVLAAPEE